MQTIIQAVVLRNVGLEPIRLSLYTSLYGRLTVHDMRRKKQWQEAIVGDICYASLAAQGNRWFLYDLESVVTRVAGADMSSFFWQNHILDMYFYYVPLQQPSGDLFSLLIQILRISVAPDIVFKLFVAHFFSLLGYHVPEQLRWYRQVLGQIELHGLEQGIDPQLKMELEVTHAHSVEILDQWLMSMVVQHDHFHYLKTQNFLTQLYRIAG